MEREEFKRLGRVGEEVVVLAREGKDNTVVGKYADGRVILFSDDSMYKINPGDTVVGEIVRDAKNYVLVEPKRVLGDTLEALIFNLDHITRGSYYSHSIFSRALLYLIKKDIE